MIHKYIRKCQNVTEIIANSSHFIVYRNKNGEVKYAVKDRGIKKSYITMFSEILNEIINLGDISYVAFFDDYSPVCVAGLRPDGTVVAAFYEGSNRYLLKDSSAWHNIVAISWSGNNLFGLKSDGTVVATNISFGAGKLEHIFSKWNDIIEISAGSGFVSGLKSDGTVISSGLDMFIEGYSHDYTAYTSQWHNIINISTGERHVVGLKSDGTVIAAGDNARGQCNISSWCNVIAVYAADNYTIGLKEDGSVLATGRIPCEEQSWRDVKYLPFTYKWTYIKNRKYRKNISRWKGIGIVK
jgi:hypothetical protein